MTNDRWNIDLKKVKITHIPDRELRCGAASETFFHGETNFSVWRSRPGPLRKRGIPPTRRPEGTPPSLPTGTISTCMSPDGSHGSAVGTGAQPRYPRRPPTTPLQWPQGRAPTSRNALTHEASGAPHRGESKRRGQRVGQADQRGDEGARGGKHER